MSEELLPLVITIYLQKTVETRMKSCDNHLVGKRKEAGHYSGLNENRHSKTHFDVCTSNNKNRIPHAAGLACPQLWLQPPKRFRLALPEFRHRPPSASHKTAAGSWKQIKPAGPPCKRQNQPRRRGRTFVWNLKQNAAKVGP